MRQPRWYVGLDLAWGERNQTGLAVLDGEGRLYDVRGLRTDGEIRDALEPLVADGAMVAIDAPLIVENQSGGRDCERELSAVYRRFQAGAYLSNRGQPAFSDGGRARRLATQLGLDVDPESSAPRRAIEVYPHPATVALFGLEVTLKYKSRNRDVASRRAAMLRLADLVESLAEHDPPALVGDNASWRSLRTDVMRATRHVDLGRAEDPLDAVLCAYVGLLAVRRPEAVTTFGDAATGYIVTPHLAAEPAAPTATW